MHNSNHGTRSLFSCAACANRFSSSSILSSISCSPSLFHPIPVSFKIGISKIPHERQSNSHCLLVIGMSNTVQNRIFDFLPRPDHPAAPLQQNVHLGVGWEWLGTSIPVPLQQTNLSSAKSLLCCSAFKLWMCALSLSTCPGLYIINHNHLYIYIYIHMEPSSWF